MLMRTARDISNVCGMCARGSAATPVKDAWRTCRDQAALPRWARIEVLNYSVFHCLRAVARVGLTRVVAGVY
jgi:hypothetical protein